MWAILRTLPVLLCLPVIRPETFPAAIPLYVKNSTPTFAQALQQGIAQLSERLGAHARLDAQVLLAAATRRSRAQMIAHPEQTLTQDAAARYGEWLERRAAGTPVAQIVGRKEFWSLELTVTADVLTPRPETELLVELALGWLPADEAVTVLDLGTGSGAIALAIASERPRARIVATDICAAALEVARANAAKLGLANIRFLQGSWFEPLGRKRFELIVSNPPYVAAAAPELQTPELLAEPRRALTPGPAGLEAIEEIAIDASEHLIPGGRLAVEHGADQGPAVAALLSQHGLRDVRGWQDLAGRDRVTAASTA